MPFISRAASGRAVGARQYKDMALVCRHAARHHLPPGLKRTIQTFAYPKCRIDPDCRQRATNRGLQRVHAAYQITVVKLPHDVTHRARVVSIERRRPQVFAVCFGLQADIVAVKVVDVNSAGRAHAYHIINGVNNRAANAGNRAGFPGVWQGVFGDLAKWRGAARCYHLKRKIGHGVAVVGQLQA